jgi:hypothetical protein
MDSPDVVAFERRQVVSTIVHKGYNRDIEYGMSVGCLRLID